MAHGSPHGDPLDRVEDPLDEAADLPDALEPLRCAQAAYLEVVHATGYPDAEDMGDQDWTDLAQAGVALSQQVKGILTGGVQAILPGPSVTIEVCASDGVVSLKATLHPHDKAGTQEALERIHAALLAIVTLSE